MCGIAGIWRINGDHNADELAAIARKMGDALIHRGPDDAGIFVDSRVGLALSHRRLSIIDTSDNGRQPMVSSCGRFVVCYNGEIYNAEQLRHELTLKDYHFRGHSDTEVLVEGLTEYGVVNLTKKLNGIFSFAVFDRKDRRLWLVRDRIGVKPLYYGFPKKDIIFGSELKAFIAPRLWPLHVNRNVISSFLRHSYVPAPFSIYEGIFKLAPGTAVSIDDSGQQSTYQYWHLSEFIHQENPVTDEREAKEVLTDLLKDAVRRQMVSDVPLGALLSGGIDSSLVVSLMQSMSNKPVHTFSIGFSEENYNEAPYAKTIAQHLGTEHHQLYVTPEETREVIPRLPEIYDEPFSDSSQIPTYLLSALTRRHVTVALSGDGGDEIFGGYHRYFAMNQLLAQTERIPSVVLRWIANMSRYLKPDIWQKLVSTIPKGRQSVGLGYKISALLRQYSSSAPIYYPLLHCHWPSPEYLTYQSNEPKGILWDPGINDLLSNTFSRFQYLDTLTYLPDDVLTKVDRASMAESLEVRVPLLDHRVVELSWRMSMAMKVRGSTGKWILREILSDYVPTDLFSRPKMGFGVPIGKWLRDPLREWAEDLINPASLRKYDLLEPDLTWKLWNQHKRGDYDWGYWLWDVLMFQAWMDYNSSS